MSRPVCLLPALVGGWFGRGPDVEREDGDTCTDSNPHLWCQLGYGRRRSGFEGYYEMQPSWFAPYRYNDPRLPVWLAENGWPPMPVCPEVP